MISDKLSVGPPQMIGEIDAFNVRFDQHKKIESVQDKQTKKEFSEILNKRDKEIRETSGGINRKMSERKIDKNQKKFAGNDDKEEKETQPTLNPMAFSQSSVKVEDFDKNPEVKEVSESDQSVIATDEIKTNAFADSMDQAVEIDSSEPASTNPLMDLDKVMVASAMTAEEPVVETVVMMPETPVMNQFQTDVMHALKQSQNDFQSQVKESPPQPEIEGTIQQGTTSKTADMTTLMNHSGAERQTNDFAEPQNSFQSSLQVNQTGRSDSKEEFKGDLKDAGEKSEKISTKLNDSILAQQPSLHGLQNHQDFQTGAATAAATGKTLDSALNSQNTNEIVKQAEILVKEGGGTAKIRLTPEGMGSVDLQITMNQGKVQVEMNTSDPHARKLLQDSITDLRSSLASHNFNLDHVKINNMSSTADLSHQNFNSHSEARSNMNQQFGRQEQKEAPQQNFVNSNDRVTTEARTAPMVHSQKIQRGYAGMKQGSSLNMVA